MPGTDQNTNGIRPTQAVKIYKKVAWRIIPILFVCYILAYLDRINVGFAKLQMQQDLGISDSVYGSGAGMFFVGYFLFEVPANIALTKVGAKLWLSAIMALWGIVSAAHMFVHTAADFYVLRFLLGVVEAGFFPGVLLFLTLWYPRQYRTRMTAAFMAAIPLSGAIGGPISGWILAQMSVFGGLRGWQWLYLIEGIPSIIAGIVSYLLLDDEPSKACWLSTHEKEIVVSALAAEERDKIRAGNRLHTGIDAFKSPAIWIFSAIFFGFAMGSYGVGFWLPQMIKDKFTADPWRIGLLSAIPWSVGAIAMIFFGRRCDRSGAHRRYVVTAGSIGSIAFAASALPCLPNTLSLFALTIATAGVMVTISTFWALPTSMLSATAAAAGIAWINSLGSLSGYLCPSVVGKIRDETHSMTPALLMLSGFCLAASIGVALFKSTHRPKRVAVGSDAVAPGAAPFYIEQFGALHD
ncbi:MAG TPA: MFS transporter [Bryobacteraceae bacterium]